jgi:hypothetical protein
MHWPSPYAVRPPQVEVVADDLLEKFPATQGPVDLVRAERIADLLQVSSGSAQERKPLSRAS